MTIHPIRTVAFAAVLAAGALPGTAAAQRIPATTIRSGAVADSLRPFFDSLAAVRRGATVVPASVPLDTTGGLRWLALFRDQALVGLVRDAVGGNVDLRMAQARLREYRAILGVERSGLFPSIDGNASAAKQQVVFGSLGAQSFDAFRVTADLAWELDLWGRIRKNAAGARADLLGQEEERRATVLSLVATVAQSYLELRELDQKLAIAKRTLTSRQSTLRLAERRLAEGVISELDVRQFEAEVAAPAARVAEFTRDIARKEHELARLIGRPSAVIPRGGELSTAVNALVVPDSLSSALVARRPDVAAAERGIDAAEARAGAAKAARLPRFLITGQYGSQAQEAGDLFGRNTEIYAVQAGVSVPLFTGGRVSNQQAAADARSEQAKLRYENTVLTALREVGDALVGARAGRDQYSAQLVQATALRRAYDLAVRRYDAGIASYLEVLDAQRGLFNAELALTEAEREYLVSAVALYRALGGSWEQ